MFDLARNSSREAEILEILLSNGWDYMRQLLSGSKTDEPELPPPTVLRNVLTDLGPVYVKLGQLLSTRPDLLPADYLTALSSLQSQVPPVPAAEIEQFIRRELPVDPNEVFTEINYQAIAAGSLGQTHRAVRRDGRLVAVKVQRPGIEYTVKRDIDLIENVAQLVASTQFGRRFDVVSLAQEFTRALRNELDFTQEGRYTQQLRQNLAAGRWFDPSQIVVPEIDWDLTTPKILVMEWMEGQSLLSEELRSQRLADDTERAKVVRLLVRAFLQQYLIDGLFHADPHPGNLFYLDDGRLALLDCGMVGTLDSRTRSILTELMLAILNGDAKRCTQLSLDLAEPVAPVDLIRLEKNYDRLLKRYSNRAIAEIDTSEAFQAVLQAGVRNNLRWSGNIGLFSKSLANLEGSGRSLYPDLDLQMELAPLAADLFRYQILGENPMRSVLQTALEFKNLSLASPRQFGFILDRLSSETFSFNLSVPEVDRLRRSITESANRRTFGTVLSSLIIGTAILASSQKGSEVQILSDVLFVAAAILAVWLLISILRSGQLR
jgi:predicted unusual protein kinase regulating ubiquinone biosynthesis (AarF/ABC1/UbiB family)